MDHASKTNVLPPKGQMTDPLKMFDKTVKLGHTSSLSNVLGEEKPIITLNSPAFKHKRKLT